MSPQEMLAVIAAELLRAFKERNCDVAISAGADDKEIYVAHVTHNGEVKEHSIRIGDYVAKKVKT